MTDHVTAMSDLFLGPLLCDFNDFFLRHGFSTGLPSAASTWATSSTLMHLQLVQLVQLVPLTWKCIHHEWMNEWVSEWMNVEWAGWNLKWWGKRRWTVNVKISAVSAPISFYLSMVCGIAFMPFVRILELYRLILFDGKKCEDHLALTSIIFKVNIS